MAEKNTDRILDLILSQIEKLNENQEKLSQEIQKTNLELTKLTGVKHAISNLIEWKGSIDKVANADDISRIKEFYTKHQDINSDIIDIYTIMKELRDSSDSYENFKTKTSTIITVISFLFATALTSLGLLLKWK